MRKGFTMIELMIVIVLIGIIVAGTIPFISNSIGRNELQTSTWEVVDALRRAQSQAVAGQQNSDWSVHVEANQVVVFDGGTYNASDPDNFVISIPNVITITGISLNGGGSDVTFTKIRGITDDYGTITLTEDNTGDTKTVTINQRGLVE